MTFYSRVRAIVVAAGILASLAIAVMEGPAEAAVQPCTISKVSFEQTNSTTAGLVISCAGVTGTFNIYVGSANACNTDIGTVQAMEAIAMMARTTTATLSISYTDTTCVGQSRHMIDYLAF